MAALRRTAACGFTLGDAHPLEEVLAHPDPAALLRQDGGGRETAYRVDLTDGAGTMQSPAYYLQQDDVVYVSPNDVRKRQTTANGSTPLTPSFWISIASLLTTVAVLIWK